MSPFAHHPFLGSLSMNIKIVYFLCSLLCCSPFRAVYRFSRCWLLLSALCCLFCCFFCLDDISFSQVVSSFRVFCLLSLSPLFYISPSLLPLLVPLSSCFPPITSPISHRRFCHLLFSLFSPSFPSLPTHSTDPSSLLPRSPSIHPSPQGTFLPLPFLSFSSKGQLPATK